MMPKWSEFFNDALTYTFHSRIFQTQFLLLRVLLILKAIDRLESVDDAIDTSFAARISGSDRNESPCRKFFKSKFHNVMRKGLKKYGLRMQCAAIGTTFLSLFLAWTFSFKVHFFFHSISSITLSYKATISIRADECTTGLMANLYKWHFCDNSSRWCLKSI